MAPTVTEGSLETPMLSAMQVKKWLKRKEVTYLATRKEEKDDGLGKLMPMEIKEVLDEFKDVMPPSFLRDFLLGERKIIKSSWSWELSPLLWGHIGWHHPSWRS